MYEASFTLLLIAEINSAMPDHVFVPVERILWDVLAEVLGCIRSQPTAPNLRCLGKLPV